MKLYTFKSVENRLIKTGMVEIYLTHSFTNSKQLTLSVQQKLKDIFITDCLETIYRFKLSLKRKVT